MLIISVWAPWAQLIVLGLKDVENRSRATKQRGELAIQATHGGPSKKQACEILVDLHFEGLITMSTAETIADRIEADRGHVIGLADLVGCIPADSSSSRWAVKGQHGYAYELAKPRELFERLPMRGVQSMRTLKPAEANAIRLAVARRG